ncbi:MAG: hypothetical protein LC649_02260 [Bacteroidales bacterium]|nr:hypothetical protein [Bacteroidales bacterium]
MTMGNDPDRLGRLMSGAGRKMPFLGFEDEVMKEIEARNAMSRLMKMEIRLSRIFFIAGLVIGGVVLSVPGLSFRFAEENGIPPWTALIMIALLLVLLLFSEKLARVTSLRNSNHQ